MFETIIQLRRIPLLAALCLPTAAVAQDDASPTEPTSGTDDATDHAGDEAPEDEPNKRSIAVLPGAFYGQETGVGLAAFGSITTPLPGTGEDTWPSTVSSAIVGTFKKQASVTVWPTLYFGTRNAVVLEGEVYAAHFPTRFYGVGNDTSAQFQSFTRRRAYADLKLRRRVYKELYIGISEHINITGIQKISGEMIDEKTQAADASGDVLLGTEVVSGETGSRVHLPGVQLKWDGRDNDQSARHGAYAELTVAGSHKAIGSTHNFSQATLDGRVYHTIGEGKYPLTLGAHWVTELRRGDVPFTSMAEAGGDDILRGMFQGRFLDHSKTAVQAEVRFPLGWRPLRGAAFASTGQVFRDLSDLAETPPTWTAGGGLRIEIDPVTHSTIRLDMAGGPDGSGFIFTFGEAF